MKKTLLFIILGMSGLTYAQQCSQPVFPHVPGQSGGNYHIFSDTTINDPNGSNYYVCGGVTLTMSYSAGCNYQLEAGANLIIQDHAGDNVLAKGNCSITDNSTENIVITKEASTTVSKPNAPLSAIVFTCSTVTFDYSPVGGSSPCGSVAGINENSDSSIRIFPNPVNTGTAVQFSEPMKSVVLYDASGRLIFSLENDGITELSTSGLQQGLYLIRGTSIHGTLIEQRITVR